MKIFEKYRRRYSFDSRLEYDRGFLYDHLAFQTKERKYFRKALSIYKKLTEENQRDPLPFHGLSRVYQELGEERAAASAEKKAYRLLQKLPKNQRGVLGAGNVFLLQGKYGDAEKWFKKELRAMGWDDFAANANLLIFYDSIGEYQKALPYAIRTEKLFEKELKLLPKKFRDARNNATVRTLKQRIKRVKSLARNKNPVPV